MINKLLYICFVYFIVSAIADIILNFLSRKSYSPLKVRALKPYFLRNTIVKNNIVKDILSAFNAGITIVIALIVTMFVSSIIFKFNHPSSLYELFLFLCIHIQIPASTSFVPPCISRKKLLHAILTSCCTLP